MRVCGVIAEYDPFHLGHRHHLKEARAQAGADYVAAVIGCAFSQRGEAMLFSTHDRARMALLGGADLVLGMPVSFSCAQANRFARGGISILHGLGPVSHLSFGCEAGSAALLMETAELLLSPTPDFTRRLKAGLQAGQSFARAQGAALAACLPGTAPEAFSAQLYSGRQLPAGAGPGSPMVPVPIPRSGNYHDRALTQLPSATAVRSALLQGDWPGLEGTVPEGSLAQIRQAAENGRLHRPGALDRLITGLLIENGEPRLTASPEMSEGLERRILAMAHQSAGREELTARVKTKRYTHARVSRALSHALLGLSRFPERPGYARLLGFRKSAAPLLKAIKQAGFPLIDRPGRRVSDDFAQDMRAEALWALGAGLAPESAWQNPVIVMD